MKIVITGGHHTSALPVIKKLQQDNEIELFWFGHKNSLQGNKNKSLEYIDITSLNIPFYSLNAGKFYKTYNVIRLLKIPYGFFQAFLLLLKIRPNLILSFGGYLAVPTVLAGWVLRIPSITHEQTVVVGWANKVVSKFAKTIMITWPSSAKFFPQEKTVITGIPLRQEIFDVVSLDFKINDQMPTIYITGGKTGAHIINSVVLEILDKLLDVANVIHQIGDHSEFDDFSSLSQKYAQIKDLKAGKYFPNKFVYNDKIGEVFNKSNLVIGRSGAHITYELLALKKPCLLIPIPWVSHNEQFKNAKVVEKAGLAQILPEENLSGDIFFENISNMLQNLSRYQISEQEYSKYNFENSVDLITNEIYKALKKS